MSRGVASPRDEDAGLEISSRVRVPRAAGQCTCRVSSHAEPEAACALCSCADAARAERGPPPFWSTVWPGLQTTATAAKRRGEWIDGLDFRSRPVPGPQRCNSRRVEMNASGSDPRFECRHRSTTCSGQLLQRSMPLQKPSPAKGSAQRIGSRPRTAQAVCPRVRRLPRRTMPRMRLPASHRQGCSPCACRFSVMCSLAEPH